MNDLQKIQLEMLKYFAKVCEENNLRYYLMGGTALGAVRHKGFIPWDDDIDVAMPREDYEKLMKMQNKFPDYYFIQNYKTDPHYVYNFAKIRDSRTTYIENFFKDHRINHGVWIDIFPLDGVTNKLVDPKKFRHKMHYIWYCTYLCYLPGLLRVPHFRTFFKDIALDFVGVLTWIFNPFHLRNRWIDFILKSKKYDKYKYIASHMGNIPKKATMPKEFYGNGKKILFEDTMLVGPEDADGYLTWVYRNYMQFPPADQQIGHHYNKGFSLTQGYKEYCKEHKI